MAVLGISSYLANAWLNTVRNVPFTVGQTCVQMHTGHPGDGTDDVGLGGARQAAVFGAAADGGIELTGGMPTWAVTGAETLTHVSVWDAYEDGNLLWTAALRIPRVVANGDTFTLNAADLGIVPLAVG